MIRPGLYKNMSNEDYHAQHPVESHYFSSSQLKDALEDMQLFIDKYITRKLEKRESISAFDVGTYYHTALLEPHLLESQFAVYEGEVRRGTLYDEFKKEHAGKIILNRTQYIEAENVVQATLSDSLFMDLIDDPLAQCEWSCFTELMGVRVKARADVIRLGKDRSYILDLKSTTGNVRNEKKIRQKIHSLDYEMSAAFYIDVFNDYIAKHMPDIAPITEWYWGFASKDLVQTQVWKATPDMLSVGRNKAQRALRLIAEHEACGWEIPQKILDIDAYITEKQEWLPPKANPAKKNFGQSTRLKLGTNAQE